MGPKLCTIDDAVYGHFAHFEKFLVCFETKLIILEYNKVGLEMMKCKKIPATLKEVTKLYLETKIL